MTRPPRLAQWLLERWTLGPRRMSVVGDLLEHYQRGRSGAWYWRQVMGAVVAGVVHEVWLQRWLVLSVGVVGLSLPRLYLLSPWPARWVWALDHLWYPRLVASRWSWLAVDPWAYRLQPYLWTSRLAWCVLLAMVAWTLGRVCRRHIGMALVTLLCTQVGPSLPSLGTAFSDWWRHSSNPMWLFSLCWSGFFAVVAVPSSILIAGLRHRHPHGRSAAS